MAFDLRQLLALIHLVVLASGAPFLPADEVEALKEIATTLGKTDWNFKVDPCSNDSGWIDPTTDDRNRTAVTCNCTFQNNTVCHVISIVLKTQNLPGKLPPEIVKLPYLQEIDLTRNYLNGTIPPEWGSTKLVNISIGGNRVSGRIPTELANISTLANLTMEYNQLSGSIPPEFGNLSNIDKLVFTSNYLTGELPDTLAKLTSVKDFRISDNNFSGSIPNFIEKWINIKKLIIQGSGLTGPIPRGIAFLTNLTDLRISDLNGVDSEFPDLENIGGFENLILRSCNIVGELPHYIGGMKNLKILDLSFNKLTGPIPESFVGLKETDFIYLTGNSLTGPLPSWMQNDGDAIDLSYNNFTSVSTELPNCQPRTLNLFASSKGNTSGIVSCLRSANCNQTNYFLHINCGGGPVDYKGTTYEEDINTGGDSNFFKSKTNWGFSSTGNFVDDKKRDTRIFSSDGSNINGPNSKLYNDARLSPLSLTYYGFCMRNGTYKVILHFAEIMFTDDRSFSSLGRRIFDVYIQGIRVLKDFNIADKAGGVNKGITENFTANVTDNTLDIRFYWAGKGTDGLPSRGVYGPLISAISVIHRDYTPPNNISTGAIIGIVIGVLFTVLLFLVILWWRGCLRRKSTLEHDLKGLELNTGLFTLRQIQAATNYFDPINKIGEGGFGPVYKGLLSDGTSIAVKQLSSKSKQGNREFVNEIGMISALQHPHLVKLHGCCIEGNQLLLIYEYMENNSLARALFGPEEQQLKLDWPTRRKICIGLARGLAYLHEESRLKIVHRDIKATNVLLDKDLNPKISDFGLAKLDDEDNTHISTRIAGTFGYMAPEYAMRGHLTDKADVYSFGVVLLEIVSGRSNSSIKLKEDAFYLLDWAHSLKEKGYLLELVDPRLESNFNEKEVITTINVALHCTNVVAIERPSMSTVVSILEGRAGVMEFVSESTLSIDNIDTSKVANKEELNDGRGKSMSMDVPWTVSSTSTSDLYPLTLDSDYWDKRL